jgi:sulfur relay (sulfurtransferase) DsrF/TusC family protein
MTKEHKVMYKGKMVQAYKFLNISSEVKRVKYSGETDYNVLQEQYGTMIVNNLICETLHPDNLIAKIYRNRFTDEYNDRVIYIMNESLEKRKYYEYKTIVNRIHTSF